MNASPELMFTYQRLSGGEGLQVFGFGQLRDQVLWVHIHLREGGEEERALSDNTDSTLQ